jgi:hypothetical protein
VPILAVAGLIFVVWALIKLLAGLVTVSFYFLIYFLPVAGLITGLYFLYVHYHYKKLRPPVYPEKIKQETRGIKTIMNEKPQNPEVLKPLMKSNFSQEKVDGLMQWASSFTENPEKYTGMLTGWVYLNEAKKAKEAVEIITEFTNTLTNLSNAITELNETKRTNEIRQEFTEQIARAKFTIQVKQLELEQRAIEIRKLAYDAEAQRLNFVKKLYEADPKNLTENELAAMRMFQTISYSDGLNDSGYFSSSQMGDPEGILKISQEKEVLRMALNENAAKLEAMRAEVKVKEQDVKIKFQQERKEKAEADKSEISADRERNYFKDILNQK